MLMLLFYYYFIIIIIIYDDDGAILPLLVMACFVIPYFFFNIICRKHTAARTSSDIWLMCAQRGYVESAVVPSVASTILAILHLDHCETSWGTKCALGTGRRTRRKTRRGKPYVSTNLLLPAARVTGGAVGARPNEHLQKIWRMLSRMPWNQQKQVVSGEGAKRTLKKKIPFTKSAN